MTTTRYSIGEEIANAITHGIGALLSIAGLAVLVSFAALDGDAWHVVSTSIFGATLVLLYAASTVYHSVWHYPTKRILQRCDHSAIFLLIAGTYTPFALVNMRGPWGWTLFGIIWSLALLGIALQLFPRRRNERLALLLYLGMGWMAVAAIKPFLAGVEDRRVDPATDRRPVLYPGGHLLRLAATEVSPRDLARFRSGR